MRLQRLLLLRQQHLLQQQLIGRDLIRLWQKLLLLRWRLLLLWPLPLVIRRVVIRVGHRATTD